MKAVESDGGVDREDEGRWINGVCVEMSSKDSGCLLSASEIRLCHTIDALLASNTACGVGGRV